ncbi:hypothetical protein AVEN_51542-1 [Araneus ventricosus]|uniref:Uncharacterized protein n=1 Tax=Araneus ventricosus TaxID=182803 RepID=A0A4Y2W8K8_ARAVE|nr:hypothetical protein AVEN_51542-1 [Araneus ventricosus]
MVRGNPRGAAATFPFLGINLKSSTRRVLCRVCWYLNYSPSEARLFAAISLMSGVARWTRWAWLSLDLDGVETAGEGEGG